MRTRHLKQKLARRELVVGTLMTLDFWPGYLEIYKSAGLDCVVLDMEHGSASPSVAEELCRIARLIDLPLILRPEASLYHLLRKYLDMGPAGFMIPRVEREEQVQILQEAAFCPPKGRRGPGGPAIYGVSSWDRAGWDEVEQNLIVLLQVETAAGIETMKKIMAHDWVDAIVLGPYDLSLDLGHCNERSHPELLDAISTVIQKARELDKPCGMPVISAEETMFWKERGCNLFLYSEAVEMVRAKIGQYMAEIH